MAKKPGRIELGEDKIGRRWGPQVSSQPSNVHGKENEQIDR